MRRLIDLFSTIENATMIKRVLDVLDLMGYILIDTKTAQWMNIIQSDEGAAAVRNCCEQDMDNLIFVKQGEYNGPLYGSMTAFAKYQWKTKSLPKPKPVSLGHQEFLQRLKSDSFGYNPPSAEKIVADAKKYGMTKEEFQKMSKQSEVSRILPKK